MSALKKMIVIWAKDRDELKSASDAAIEAARASGVVAAFGLEYQEIDKPEEDEDYCELVEDLLES